MQEARPSLAVRLRTVKASSRQLGLKTRQRQVSPYRLVRAVKAFRDGVTRVGEPSKRRGRRRTRGKCNKGRPQDGRRETLPSLTVM